MPIDGSKLGNEEGASLYLVSCVSMKRASPSPARDLYVSQWFLKARAHVEAAGWPWLILSAEHGVVHPDQVAGTGPCRSVIPEQADHPFRRKPITDSGASRSLNA